MKTPKSQDEWADSQKMMSDPQKLVAKMISYDYSKVRPKDLQAVKKRISRIGRDAFNFDSTKNAAASICSWIHDWVEAADAYVQGRAYEDFIMKEIAANIKARQEKGVQPSGEDLASLEEDLGLEQAKFANWVQLTRTP